MNTTSSTSTRLIGETRLAQQINILPKSATMKGDMEASEDLSIRIDGEYEGTVRLEKAGTVHIAKGAIVTTTQIVADHIFVEGTVKGDLHARKGIELAPTAQVKGAIKYEHHMDMHPGAKVSGQIDGPDTGI